MYSAKNVLYWRIHVHNHARAACLPAMHHYHCLASRQAASLSQSKSMALAVGTRRQLWGLTAGHSCGGTCACCCPGRLVSRSPVSGCTAAICKYFYINKLVLHVSSRFFFRFFFVIPCSSAKLTALQLALAPPPSVRADTCTQTNSARTLAWPAQLGLVSVCGFQSPGIALSLLALRSLRLASPCSASASANFPFLSDVVCTATLGQVPAPLLETAR